MSARFIDEHVSREGRYSLGRDLKTSGYYISIPVANSLVDYEEYSNISAKNFVDYLRKPSIAMTFADECRGRIHDDRLILLPGADRGTPL